MNTKLAWNNFFWFFAAPIRTVYRFLFRPHGYGAKVLVKSGDSFLLVRTTYGHKSWTLPGGAVERGETPEIAARRELMEEIRLIVREFIPLGEYSYTENYKTNTVYCLLAPLDSMESVVVDGVEIAEAKWFRPDELPSNRVSRVDKILNLYQQLR